MVLCGKGIGALQAPDHVLLHHMLDIDCGSRREIESMRQGIQGLPQAVQLAQVTVIKIFHCGWQCLCH
jgi:hypothetical protein